MQSFIKLNITNRREVPTNVVGTIFIVLFFSVLQGCGDKYNQVDCNYSSAAVMHPSGEFCMCDETSGWMYDYEYELWECNGLAQNLDDNPNYYGLGFTFNGDQMGPFNDHYLMQLWFTKTDSTFFEVKLDNRGRQESSGLYVRNESYGDSLYMKDLRLRNTFNSSDFAFEGKRCFVAGRGRVSPDKDTLDMTAYIIPWEDYALVESANGVYRDNRDIDISKAADVRKMQFLSARAFPKYAK